MGDLKPCPFCGGKAIDSFRGVGCADDFCPGVHIRCSESEWNTRPAPELPEGYRETNETHWQKLFFGDERVASIGSADGQLLAPNVPKRHLLALAIWLQRRSK